MSNNRQLTTNEVCEALGVARNWVNRHLRSIGVRDRIIIGGKENNAILYDEEKLLNWINENALLTSQTVAVNLADFGRISQEEVKERATEAQKDTREGNSVEWRLLLLDAMPEDVYEEYSKYVIDPRQRTALPWVPVEERITKLEQLHTMNQLLEAFQYSNNEMVYREIFKNCGIKVTIQGRTWFMLKDENVPKPPKGIFPTVMAHMLPI